MPAGWALDTPPTPPAWSLPQVGLHDLRCGAPAVRFVPVPSVPLDEVRGAARGGCGERAAAAALVRTAGAVLPPSSCTRVPCRKFTCVLSRTQAMPLRALLAPVGTHKDAITAALEAMEPHGGCSCSGVDEASTRHAAQPFPACAPAPACLPCLTCAHCCRRRHLGACVAVGRPS